MPPPCSDASDRRRLKKAVVPAVESAAPNAPPLTAVSGLILDASPHLLVLDTADTTAAATGAATGDGDEVRLQMSEATSVWYGGRASPSVLRPGRRVIVRPTGDGLAADRIWVEITRLTGTIVECGRDVMDVDAGPHRGRAHVVIPSHTLSAVLVRHPYFEPGYLVDVIGVRSSDGLVAIRPGTSQPSYRANAVPAPRPSGPAPHVLRGTATWFDSDGEDRHAAYPALDPWGGGCLEASTGCAGLPYLSLGSELQVRNECTGRAVSVPVAECGCVAARYCDRCVECGTSPRGRIVELTTATFVDLGGDLDSGCFNVTVGVG